jgi:ribulose-bisphosphate carboxylase small chain
MAEVKACRRAFPGRYVKVNAFDATRGWETVRLSFLVQRPAVEPTFELVRQEVEGRRVRYTLHARDVPSTSPLFNVRSLLRGA